MFVEAFHKVFKYNHLGRKLNERADGALANLIIFARLIKPTKGKSSKRIALLHK